MMDILKIIVWYVLNVDHDVKLARMKQINVYPVMKVNLEKIFDMYYRGANVKNEPGMGVGLWITREIVKKIKGEINVSRDGDRVIFSVYIPISFSI